RTDPHPAQRRRDHGPPLAAAAARPVAAARDARADRLLARDDQGRDQERHPRLAAVLLRASARLRARRPAADAAADALRLLAPARVQAADLRSADRLE